MTSTNTTRMHYMHDLFALLNFSCSTVTFPFNCL